MSHRDIDYFEWLMDQVEVNLDITKYKNLYWALFTTPFQITHPRDDNRRIDGLDLRWKYSHDSEFLLEKPCSVLEMFIGLAARIDLEWNGNPGEPAPASNFWNMITQLGLQKFTDHRWNPTKVQDILWKFMKKNDPKYMIFPVPKDLRSEFWVQAIHSLKR